MSDANPKVSDSIQVFYIYVLAGLMMAPVKGRLPKAELILCASGAVIS
jgi:hypothetical protein